MLLKGTKRTWRTQGEKKRIDYIKHRFNKFQHILTLLCAKESKSEKALVLLNNCVSYLGVNISSFIYIQRNPHLFSFLEDRTGSLDGNFNWMCSGCCTRTLMCRPMAGKKRLFLTTYTLIHHKYPAGSHNSAPSLTLACLEAGIVKQQHKFQWNSVC